jgi:hypothetical protein
MIRGRFLMRGRQHKAVQVRRPKRGTFGPVLEQPPVAGDEYPPLGMSL